MNDFKNYYQLSADEVLKKLATSRKGLTDKEAAERSKIYGENKLHTEKKEFFLMKFLRQMKDPMVIILIAAGTISLFLNQYRDATLMYLIVAANAIIGFIQEYKAEKIMQSLKNLVKAEAKIIRDGREIETNAEELVPGDLVSIEEGDAVPADLRILEESYLGTNDFSLTGESNPTKKFHHAIRGQVQLCDRNNVAFMGTTVATGKGLGVVVATGMQTEIGRIANLSQGQKTEFSPLQKEIGSLSKTLTIITLAVAGCLFLVGLALKFSFTESFIFAIGIAASCVPEGMPAQISIALSLAAGRLAKKKAVVKKLSAVETLGATHIICTDKTGTLTKNEMTVQRIMIDKNIYNITGSGYQPDGYVVDADGKKLSPETLKQYLPFFETGVLASNAKVNAPDNEHEGWYSIGDPTEAALITLSNKAGFDSEKLNKDNPELKQFPFDAVRRRMTSIRKSDGKIIAYVKGAPESILDCCTKIWDGNSIRPLTDEDRANIKQEDDNCATNALRNLGFAYRELAEFNKENAMEEIEKDLVWLGLVSMIDPPRDEVHEAMTTALKANIRVIIITGDYALTAEAIAKRIGLNQEREDSTITVINGSELEALSDVELLNELIHSNLIFSRTAPEDKLRIVNLLKKAGEIVAVTGDGVNDAPALKRADIGVAMGKTGTEVAKNSAEIVLLDDSFNTLISAIKEGRVIFQNLKKTIISSLTSNGGELFAVLLSLAGTIAFHFPLAILAVQILAIDLVGEMLPLTFLTWDSIQPKIMTEAPRNPTEHIVNKSSLLELTRSSFLMGAIGYANFIFVFLREGVSLTAINTSDPFYMRATAVTYISIVLSQWMNILTRRTTENETVFTSYLWSNKRLLLGYALSLFFVIMIVYNPFISSYFHTAPMTTMDWVYAVSGALIYLFSKEIGKFMQRRSGAQLKPAESTLR